MGLRSTSPCTHGQRIPIAVPEGHTMQLGVLRCERVEWCIQCGALRIDDEAWKLPRQLCEPPSS